MKTIALLLALVLPGCAATEPDRQLNHQNQEAGKFIKENSSQPEIAKAGADVEANAATLKKNSLGEPKEPKPYSSKTSEESRKASDEAAKSPWKAILFGIGSFLLGGGGLKLAQRFFPALTGPVGTALSSVIEAISSFKKEPTEDGKVELSKLLEKLASLQDAAGVRDLVRSLVAKVEKT